MLVIVGLFYAVSYFLSVVIWNGVDFTTPLNFIAMWVCLPLILLLCALSYRYQNDAVKHNRSYKIISLLLFVAWLAWLAQIFFVIFIMSGLSMLPE